MRGGLLEVLELSESSDLESEFSEESDQALLSAASSAEAVFLPDLDVAQLASKSAKNRASNRDTGTLLRARVP